MATQIIKPLNSALKVLGASRLLLGTTCWLVPTLTAQTFAFWTLPSATSAVVRMWGAREAALGLWLLTARSHEARRKAVLFGAAVDASDAASAVMSWYTGDLPPVAALALTGGALSLVAWARFGIGSFQTVGKVA